MSQRRRRGDGLVGQQHWRCCRGTQPPPRPRPPAGQCRPHRWFTWGTTLPFTDDGFHDSNTCNRHVVFRMDPSKARPGCQSSSGKRGGRWHGRRRLQSRRRRRVWGELRFRCWGDRRSAPRPPQTTQLPQAWVRKVANVFQCCALCQADPLCRYWQVYDNACRGDSQKLCMK